MHATKQFIVCGATLCALVGAGWNLPICAASERDAAKTEEASENTNPPKFVAPDFATTDQIVGHWALDGHTILKHDLKVCGKKEISEEVEKELLPLATRLGSRYTLLIQSDGQWEFHSHLNGRIDGLEDQIFTKLTGKEPSKEYNFEERQRRFPNDPKRPLGGAWRWSEADGFRHFGFKRRGPPEAPYPVKGPGKIVVGKGTLEITDAESGEEMGFTFVRKYRGDPDPRFRGPARAQPPVPPKPGADPVTPGRDA